jgi:coenzyme F420-reducing hydrogenase alpha subunit
MKYKFTDQIHQNERFVEKILIGRKYWEVPTIISRICGTDSTVHSITSVKALEIASSIEPTRETILLRKLLLAGYIIQNHADQLFNEILPNFLGNNDILELKNSDLSIFNNYLVLKKYSDSILQIIGARSSFPIANTVGGFASYPKQENLKCLLNDYKKVKKAAEQTLELFSSFKYPSLKDEVSYLSMHTNTEYTLYDGEVWTSNDQIFEAKNYQQYLFEEKKPHTKIKFATLQGYKMQVGPIARLNLNSHKLDAKLKKLIQELNIGFPISNPFSNIMAVCIEMNLIIEQSNLLIERLSAKPLKKEHLIPPKNFSQGTASCEGTAGTFFHHYKLDSFGNIINCNILTPSIENLEAIESNTQAIMSQSKTSQEEKQELINLLVNAYNFCPNCALL